MNTEAQGQFQSERDRLLQVIGRIPDGGIVEAIRHIGSTSVPDMYGSPCVDIGLAVWPFPLEAGPKSRLASLGYHIVSGYEEAPEQRFRHESNSFQLHFIESGHAKWFDLLAVWDYLRHDRAARQEVSLKKRGGAVDKSQISTNCCPLPSSGGWHIINFLRWKSLSVN